MPIRDSVAGLVSEQMAFLFIISGSPIWRRNNRHATSPELEARYSCKRPPSRERQERKGRKNLPRRGSFYLGKRSNRGRRQAIFALRLVPLSYSDCRR